MGLRRIGLCCRCVQALSKRIHYGKFVAEAKFRAAERQYTALIKASDAEGIMDALTDRAVELKVRRFIFKHQALSHWEQR